MLGVRKCEGYSVAYFNHIFYLLFLVSHFFLFKKIAKVKEKKTIEKWVVTSNKYQSG